MRKASSNLAKATWDPKKIEITALENRSYIDNLNKVDEIWDWLSLNHGEVLAVDAPHASPPEKFTYDQLSKRISHAAYAFNRYGIQKGDVVALFSENSPRWLIVDQGLMRIGASDAVRGANAPIEELKYVIEDSNSIEGLDMFPCISTL